MKITRLVAAILAVMMVVCVLPMMQAGAAGTTYETISQALGTDMGYKMGYAFDANFVPGTDVLHSSNAAFPGRVTYVAEGMSFPVGESTLWYNKPAENPYLYGSATVVKAKFGSTSESMVIQINNKVDTGRTFIEVYPTYIRTYPGSATTNCSLGTDWFELMTVMTDANGYAVYLKNESTGNRWSLLQQVTGYRTGSTSGNMSITATASTGLLVKSVAVYQPKTFIFDDVNGIFGKEMVAGIDYAFQSGFVAGSEFAHYTGDTHPGRISFGENGAVLPANSPIIWYLTPPAGAVATNTGVAFRAKLTKTSGALNIEVNNPNASTGRAYIICNSTSMTAFGSKINDSGTQVDTSTGCAINLGTDWFDVMIAITDIGYDVYVKNGATNQQWKRVFEMGSFRKGKTFGGISVASASTSEIYLKSLQVYQEKKNTYNSVDEIFGKSMGARLDYTFDENFESSAAFTHYTGDTHPGRISYTADGASFPAGKATIWYLNSGAKPVIAGSGVRVKAKIAGNSDNFNFEINNPHTAGFRSYVTVGKSAITAYGRKMVNGAETDYSDSATVSLGSEWFELLLVPKSSGYQVYLKNAGTNNQWKMILDIIGYRSGKAFGEVSLASIPTTGVFIKELTVYQDRAILPGGESVEKQKEEIAAGMTEAKNATVIYREVAEYNPTIEKYSHIKAITYDGATYSNGKKTKVFAYVGFPEGASATNKVPAMVLIHGGGGHAYLEWVRLWNERGYAAIAMETTGYFPSAPNAGVDEKTEGVDKNYKYEFGDFAEDGYALAPQCGNPVVYTDVKDQWNFHALTGIIKAGNILRQDERVDSSKMGVTGVSWGGTLTTQLIGIDNRFAFAIPIYGTAYLSDPTCNFENYTTPYVKDLWAAEQNLSNATMPIMWYVWNSDHAFGIPQYVKSYTQTAPLNEKNVLFIRDNWGHSHGQVFNVSGAENHSKIFADWILNGNGGYPTFTKQPDGRDFVANFRVPVGVTGEITATLYYLEDPMVYTKSNGSHSLNQSWKKTTAGITVDKANGIVEGSIPASAAGYYVNLEFSVDGVACESSTLYTVVDNIEVTNLQAASGYSFRVDCQSVDEFSGKMIVGLYRGQVLESAQILDVKASQTVTFSQGGCDTVKVFWWDDFTKLNTKGRMVELGL